MISKQTVSQATVILSIFALLSGLLGYFREGLVAYIFGPGADLDAYLAAFLLPTIFMNILNATIPFVFINLFNRIRVESGEAMAWAFAMRILRWLCFSLTILTAAGIIFSAPLLKIAALGFTPEQFRLGLRYFCILAPIIIFSGIFIYATAILQACRNFWWPSLAALGMNLFPIAALLIWGSRIGITSLAWGILAGYGFQCLFVLIVLWKNRLPTGKIIQVPEINRQEWLHFILPVILLFFLDQANLMITRNLASFLEKGSISMLYFSNIILQLIQMVIIIPVCRAVYPDVTFSVAEGDMINFREKFLTTIRLFLMITLPIVMGIMVLKKEIIQLLFERGAFGPEFTRTTADIFLYYALNLIPLGLGNIFLILFFTLRKVWLPVSITLLGVAVNVGFALWLMQPFEVMGLALANLIANLVYFALMLYYLHFRIFKITRAAIYFPAIKFILAALGMSVISLLIKWSWQLELLAGLPDFLQLSSNVLLSAGFYFGIGYYFKINEFFYCLSKLKHVISR